MPYAGTHFFRCHVFEYARQVNDQTRVWIPITSYMSSTGSEYPNPIDRACTYTHAYLYVTTAGPTSRALVFLLPDALAGAVIDRSALCHSFACVVFIFLSYRRAFFHSKIKLVDSALVQVSYWKRVGMRCSVSCWTGASWSTR